MLGLPVAAQVAGLGQEEQEAADHILRCVDLAVEEVPGAPGQFGIEPEGPFQEPGHICRGEAPPLLVDEPVVDEGLPYGAMHGDGGIIHQRDADQEMKVLGVEVVPFDDAAPVRVGLPVGEAASLLLLLLAELETQGVQFDGPLARLTLPGSFVPDGGHVGRQRRWLRGWRALGRLGWGWVGTGTCLQPGDTGLVLG